MPATRSSLIVVLVAVVVMVFAGCGKQPIARVGDHQITRTEFLERLEKDQGREALLGMINRSLIEDAFTQSGLTIDPKELEERMAQIKKQYPSPETFAKLLASRGMTEADVVESIELDLKVQKLCTKDVKMDEAKLKDFLNQYKDALGEPERVSYSEIVLSTEEEAKKVAAQLAKSKDEFANLAKQHSIAPGSRENGGKVPEVPKEQLYPPQLSEALLALKPGQISEPKQLDGRWHILKLEKVLPARAASMDKDRKKIEDAFKQSQAKDPQALLTEIREKATVKIIDPKYEDLAEMFQPKGALPQFGQGGAEGQGGTPPPQGSGAAPQQPESKPAQ